MPRIAKKTKADCMHPSCAICKFKKPFAMPDQVLESALAGNLVFFIGAGVSTESSAVHPISIYDEVRFELGLNETTLSFSQLMSQYCSRDNGRRKLINKILNKVNYVYSFNVMYSTAVRFHRELATLAHLEDIFTTNWDDYLERECGATPFCTSDDFSYWDSPKRRVYKLHGSINNLGSIIATSEDYDECYRKLHEGLLGSYLKIAMATKTIVYIGYSYRDEDFIKLHRCIKDQMGNLSSQHYIVDVTENSRKRYADLGLNLIVTDGEHFVHELKCKMIGKNCQVPDARFEAVKSLLTKVTKAHRNLAANMDLSSNPQAVYSLAYQDGAEDAALRILRMHITGEYSCPTRVLQMIDEYQNKSEKSIRASRYTDAGYYDGYKNVLMYLLSKDNLNGEFPLYFIFSDASSVYYAFTEKGYKTLAKKLSKKRTKPHRMAQSQITKGKWSNDLYPQFFPYFPV